MRHILGTNKKLSYLAVLACAALPFAAVQSANATDQDVQASIQTRAAISLTLNTDMDFGIVDYVPVHSGNILLGTDASVTLSGATGLTVSGGTPTAGSVDVSGDATSVVDISCETGGSLTDGGANTLTLSATEVAVDTGAAAGAGLACAGLGTASTTVDLSSNATPTILMGGTIDTTADAIDTSATYDTAAVGGDPVTLRVTYQ